MSYTNVELIRHHLVSAFPTAEQVVNQALYFKGDDYLPFFNGAIDGSVLKVKTLKSNSLSRSSITLGSSPVSVAASPIAPGSVVVASDSSMGTLYVENTDYAIDYSVGTIAVKSGGSLSVGQAVTVWYQTFATYTDGADYQVRVDSGEIKRVVSGEIIDGETVFLDYSPIYDSFNDDVLNNAVAEANSLVEQEVDPDGQFGADRTLQAAATQRALAIVCRTAAARELSSRRGEDRTALAWMKLSDQYAAGSEQLLNRFRPPAQGPSAPVHS
ncbi:MAG: hypothetical protein OEV49_07515 [candidate division Zixibacteria bacterium]|nr:hypothetical protein [candidate division Zixibacteria bacterium]MDH3936085.1 hypothetical protein [candidate division Zixibacteria bacterium]MDH4032231.1 hypothetical protein [candidate division Zixibacteria bacterium]